MGWGERKRRKRENGEGDREEEDGRDEKGKEDEVRNGCRREEERWTMVERGMELSRGEDRRVGRRK